LQRIAHEVGKVLDDGQLVVVRQDDRVALRAQLLNALNEFLFGQVGDFGVFLDGALRFGMAHGRARFGARHNRRQFHLQV
jgi:hypothetical protein